MSPYEQGYDDGRQDYIPMGVPQVQRNDRADLIEKINPERLVDSMYHHLMGEKLVGDNWVYDEKKKTIALTEVGASAISDLLRPIANVNMSISKLSRQEISMRLLSVTDTMNEMLIAKWMQFGVKDASHMKFVFETVFNTGLAVYKQAQDASIQDLLKGTVVENRLVQDQPKKEGTLDKVRRALG